MAAGRSVRPAAPWARYRSPGPRAPGSPAARPAQRNSPRPHSSCFAMALALRLGEHQAVPAQLTVTATVTLDEAGGVPTIATSGLRVRAQVLGLDQSSFQAAVDEAAALCPVSRLFAGAKISVDAALDPAR
ncbi:MAG TPA: OsmC family protein [Streptosporangiaceae bacterium]